MKGDLPSAGQVPGGRTARLEHKCVEVYETLSDSFTTTTQVLTLPPVMFAECLFLFSTPQPAVGGSFLSGHLVSLKRQRGAMPRAVSPGSGTSSPVLAVLGVLFRGPSVHIFSLFRMIICLFPVSVLK